MILKRERDDADATRPDAGFYSTQEGFDIPEYRRRSQRLVGPSSLRWVRRPSRVCWRWSMTCAACCPMHPLWSSKSIDQDLALLSLRKEGSVTMPGVSIEIVSRRRYTYGELTSQILGFLGPIPPESVEAYEQKGYDAAVDRIGYAGIEAQYEEGAAGVPGRRMVVRDVLGQEAERAERDRAGAGRQPHADAGYTTARGRGRGTESSIGLEDAGSRRGAAIVLPIHGTVLCWQWPANPRI